MKQMAVWKTGHDTPPNSDPNFCHQRTGQRHALGATFSKPKRLCLADKLLFLA
jgi:hypothetical protein